MIEENLQKELDNIYFFGCEKCDSTWIHDPGVCTHCGNTDLYQSEFWDYNGRHCN